MYEGVPDDRHTTLVDPRVLEFISDVPKPELDILMDMRVHAEITGDELQKAAVRTILSMSPSKEGKRASQIADVIKHHPDRITDQDAAIDLPQPERARGDRAQREAQKSNGGFLSGWGLKG